jgi:2-polyprenyl-6-methoxyphenol hydroxylase-like FAD-dependent oxidoreductase
VQLGRAVTDPGATRADGTGYDLVVGADGRRSAVREAVCGPQPERYSGTTCWRGFLDLDLGDVAIEAWGGRARVGAVPVGDGRTYYYLVLAAPPGAASPSWPDGFAQAFGGFGGTAGDVVRAVLDAGPPPLHHDLIELDRPAWGAGHVLLLGDAAHAMTPNQGQGAAMAIEDAAALSLAVTDGPDGALARYTTARAARVRAVQLTSRRIGAVAHWRSQPVDVLRTAAMRATPSTVGARTLDRLVRPGVALAARLPA